MNVGSSCPAFVSTSPDGVDCNGVAAANAVAGTCSTAGGSPFLCNLIIESEAFLCGACVDAEDVCTVAYVR